MIIKFGVTSGSVGDITFPITGICDVTFEKSTDYDPTNPSSATWSSVGPTLNGDITDPTTFNIIDNTSEIYIRINGTFPIYGLGQFSYSNVEKILEILDFGIHGTINFYGAFNGASNLTSVPNEFPVNVTNLSYMFKDATNFNSNIGNWDVSKVINFSNMFQGCTKFNNGSISNDGLNPLWDDITKTVGTNIGDNKINLALTFNNATNFNQNLNNWNVSKVFNFFGMFNNATNFNNGDISNAGTKSLWNNQATTVGKNLGTTERIHLTNMFENAVNFNQNINNWHVSKVLDFTRIFYNATNFNNGDISNAGTKPLWNNQATTVGKNLEPTERINLTDMFSYAINFNQNLNNWDVSKVLNFILMFNNATNFNNGSTSNNALNPLWNFPDTTVGKNLEPTERIDLSGMFTNASNFNQKLENWDVSKVLSFNEMFKNATNFNNGSITNDSNNPLWNDPIKTVGSGISSQENINLFQIMRNANNFNQDISIWDVSKVNNFTKAFENVELSPLYYDKLINSWFDKVKLNINGFKINSHYTFVSEENRLKFVSTNQGGKGWTNFNDLGKLNIILLPQSPINIISDKNAGESIATLLTRKQQNPSDSFIYDNLNDFTYGFDNNTDTSNNFQITVNNFQNTVYLITQNAIDITNPPIIPTLNIRTYYKQGTPYEAYFNTPITINISNANSYGDPYISTLTGKTYKLADEIASYRLFEGNDIIINAEVDYISQEQQNKLKLIEKSLKEKYPNLSKLKLITNGVLFSKFYIDNSGEKLLINLKDKKAYKLSTINNITIEKEYESTFNIMNLHNSKCTIVPIKINSKNYGEIKLSLKFFENPQLENGISINIEKDGKFTGLLADTFKESDMKINDIYDLTTKLNNKYEIETKKNITQDNEIWTIM